MIDSTVKYTQRPIGYKQGESIRCVRPILFYTHTHTHPTLTDGHHQLASYPSFHPFFYL